jgi:hypothetical protein
MFWIRGYYQCKRPICQDANPRSPDLNEWDEKPYNEIEGESKLTRASVTQTYQGDIVGEGTVEYLIRDVKTVTPEEWEALKARLKDAYASVLATLKSINNWDGENELGGAPPIAIHTAYHLGEIRQALCTIKND